MGPVDLAPRAATLISSCFGRSNGCGRAACCAHDPSLPGVQVLFAPVSSFRGSIGPSVVCCSISHTFSCVPWSLCCELSLTLFHHISHIRTYLCYRLLVSGFRYTVSGFRFPASSFRFPDYGFPYPASGIRFPVSGLQFPSSSIQFPAPGFRFTTTLACWLRCHAPRATVGDPR